jgi:hypothetical protein
MTQEDRRMRGMTLYALESELGCIDRSMAWTAGRAGVEGTKVNWDELKPTMDRAQRLRDEIKRRKG